MMRSIPPESDKSSEEQPVGSVSRKDMTREQVLAAYGITGDPSEALNERAVAVMRRIADKMTGRDFLPEGAPATEADTVHRQVRRLIEQATCSERLCVAYLGWCPFW